MGLFLPKFLPATGANVDQLMDLKICLRVYDILILFSSLILLSFIIICIYFQYFTYLAYFTYFNQ